MQIKKTAKIAVVITLMLISYLLGSLSNYSYEVNDTVDYAENESDDNSQQNETDSDKLESIGIDGVIESGCFDVTVKSAKAYATLESEARYKLEATDGNELVIVFFQCYNRDVETRNEPSAIASCDGKMVRQADMMGKIDDAMILLGAVLPKSASDSYVVWELPIGWEALNIQFLDSSTGRGSPLLTIYSTDVIR